jgi:hypothetical protein
MDIMDNKIIVGARLILSKKQLYLIGLYSGMSEENAKETAEVYYNNPDTASESFSNFCLEMGEDGAIINDLLNLGLLAYAKNIGETLEDKDVYNCYLTIKKPIINTIEIEHVDIDKEYVDTYENMINKGLSQAPL